MLDLAGLTSDATPLLVLSVYRRTKDIISSPFQTPTRPAASEGVMTSPTSCQEQMVCVNMYYLPEMQPGLVS